MHAALGDPKTVVNVGAGAWSYEPADRHAEVDAHMSRLADDLASGEWDRRFGHLRAQPEFLGSLRLIVVQASG